IDDHLEQELLSLKEKVNKMLFATPNNLSNQLKFIDLIQRLGVAYHFESEIDEMLHQFYDRSDDQDIDVHDLQM
ncbi:unnamed protein product, partial [Dovyalis caffra]